MTTAPEKIWVYHTTLRTVRRTLQGTIEWSEAPLKGSTKYIRYDKHTGYLSDIRAAYGGACEQRAELKDEVKYLGELNRLLAEERTLGVAHTFCGFPMKEAFNILMTERKARGVSNEPEDTTD